MSMQLTDDQRATLTALVDTFVPSLTHDDDPHGFWARTGSDVGADVAVEQYLLTNLPEQVSAGLLQLLDAMATFGLQYQPLGVRESIIKSVAALGPEAAFGVSSLRGLAVMFAYALPDEGGRNPFWPQFGYPGPLSPPPHVPKPIKPYVPQSDAETLEADVVIVGSGAGGGTIAGVLAQQGKQVVVLEAGGYYNEADFNQLELWAHQNMFYRGGTASTADGNVTLLAGGTLGGGTTINWQNCVQPSTFLRNEWAREYGLEGLDGPEFNRHVQAVLARMQATDECSDYNGPHQRMKEAADTLGYKWHIATRNTAKATYNPDDAGYTHFGDQSGSKQGTLKTYLQDAYDHGAKILVRTRADRVLAENGRATGVAATYTDGERTAKVRIKAKDVVVACGALESPALLLRSGIGGPAVGHYLRLHPAGYIFGVYAEDQRAWWGPPQSGVMNEFADNNEGYGFLVEGSQYYTGLFAYLLANRSGKQHKEIMAQLARTSPFLCIIRDRGHGQVTIDEAGDAVHTYALTDEADQRNFRDGLATLIRMHEAAGAQEMYATSPGVAPWKRGDDLQAFIAHVQAVPVGAGGQAMGSAHQMGSCRMGSDPATSVADPFGQLHDVKGVWIGDTSAFPTPSGANPMLTCMALAHRTAEEISGMRDEPDVRVDLEELAPPVREAEMGG